LYKYTKSSNFQRFSIDNKPIRINLFSRNQDNINLIFKINLSGKVDVRRSVSYFMIIPK
jgi:hypothetical protein